MKPAFGAALGLALVAAAAPVAAQGHDLGRTPHGWMHALLERTFLRIDIVALDLCLDSAAAARVSAFVSRAHDEADDSITAAILESREVLGRLRFLRDVGYGQFLGGIADEQSKAVRAGLLDDSTHVAVRARLPDWFSFLENRNIRSGDEIVYQITADTVRTVYSDGSGVVLMDRSDTGSTRRRSVLATWLAPGSSFRDRLMQSARSSGDPGEACRPARANPGAGPEAQVRPALVRDLPQRAIPTGRIGSS